MSRSLEGKRVVDPQGHAGTVQAIEGDEAHVLFDYQGPSSQPKPVPIASLRVIS